MAKDQRIYFRCDSKQVRQLDELSKRLGLNRAATIRLSLDEATAKHTHPGYRGEITVVNTKLLDSVLMSLHNRITELESPKERSYEEAEKAARKVDKLRREGKDKEADKIVNERAKKGLWTGYFEWEKSDLTREQMLEQRYGKGFKEKKQ